MDFQQVKECTCKLGSGSARQEELPASYESGLAARQRMGEHMWMHRSGHKLAACAITVLHPYAKHPCGLFGGGGGGGGFSGHSQAGDSGRFLHVHLACHSFTQLLCCAVLCCIVSRRAGRR